MTPPPPLPDWFPMDMVVHFMVALIPWGVRMFVLGVLAGTVLLLSGLPKR